MIRNRSGWWMISSISAMSAPPHPEAAEQQPAAIDQRHPQFEPRAGKEISDQRQCCDCRPDHDKSAAQPQADDNVGQHEIGRPKSAELARGEVADADAPDGAKGNED